MKFRVGDVGKCFWKTNQPWLTLMWRNECKHRFINCWLSSNLDEFKIWILLAVFVKLIIINFKFFECFVEDWRYRLKIQTRTADFQIEDWIEKPYEIQKSKIGLARYWLRDRFDSDSRLKMPKQNFKNW